MHKTCVLYFFCVWSAHRLCITISSFTIIIILFFIPLQISKSTRSNILFLHTSIFIRTLFVVCSFAEKRNKRKKSNVLSVRLQCSSNEIMLSVVFHVLWWSPSSSSSSYPPLSLSLYQPEWLAVSGTLPHLLVKCSEHWLTILKWNGKQEKSWWWWWWKRRIMIQREIQYNTVFLLTFCVCVFFLSDLVIWLVEKKEKKEK